MKRIWFAGLFLCLSVLPDYGQHSPESVTGDEKVVIFKFPFQCDTFYLSGNDVELKQLYSYVEQYQGAITSGEMPLYLNGYCSSFKEESKNLQTAFLRGHHVKSDLILHKGLKETHFVTASHAGTYEGNKDVVTVTMRLPKEKLPVPAVEPAVIPNVKPDSIAKQPQPAVSPSDRFITVYQANTYAGGGDTVSVAIPVRPGMQAAIAAGDEVIRVDTLFKQPLLGWWDKDFITMYYTNTYEDGKDVIAVRIPLRRVAVTEGETVEKVQEKKADTVKQLPSRPKAPFRGLRFSLRTDLLYWLAVVPNAGIEWNPFDHWSILVNGLYNQIVLGGGEKQYCIEMVSPELRRHIGEDKRWFVGVEFHTGKYNFKLGETGYQGDLTGGGLTGGYQMHLNPVFDMDFHLGLGYTKLEHDSYYRSSNGVLVRKETGLKKNFIGPTQAGVSLVWRINHSNK
ncbi:hypothetical protein EZS27_003927 [termite gut metagenome]|uniref:DUF3575 domain-containing protein n=1 Tax=termite gut metagenome TaxID=433724 RepID=A0A5J4SRN9_9ZZZZ